MYKLAVLSDVEIKTLVEKIDALLQAPFSPYNARVYMDGLRNLIVAIIEKKEIPDAERSDFVKVQNVAKKVRFNKIEQYVELHKALSTAFFFWKAFKDIDQTKSEGEDFFKIDTLNVRILSKITPDKIEKVKNIISLAIVKIKRSTIPNFKETLNDLNVFITNTKKTKSIAWYDFVHDNIHIQEAYLQKGIRTELDSVHDFIHELGHRYYKKFVNANQKQEWRRFYYGTLHKQMLREFRQDLPEIGESIWEKYRVEIRKDRKPAYPNDRVVSIEPFSSDGFKFTLTNGMVFTDSDFLKFTGVPSAYSTDDEEEFFCETLGSLLNKDLRPQLKHIKEKFIEIFKGGRGDDSSITTASKKRR